MAMDTVTDMANGNGYGVSEDEENDKPKGIVGKIKNGLSKIHGKKAEKK